MDHSLSRKSFTKRLVGMFGILFSFTLRPLKAADSCNGNISVAELQSLAFLFNQTNGQNWIWNESLPADTKWTFFSDLAQGVSLPCANAWQGLDCKFLKQDSNDAQCAVLALNLINFNLSGALPEEIGGLSYMENLNLSKNFLKSSIPTGIASL